MNKIEIKKIKKIMISLFIILISYTSIVMAGTRTWLENGIFGFENPDNTGGDATKHYELYYNNNIGGGDRRSSYYDSEQGIQGYSSRLRVDGIEQTLGRHGITINDVVVTLQGIAINDSNGNTGTVVLYTINNNNSIAKTVSLSTFADICLAEDDNAPIKPIYDGNSSATVGFSSSNLKCYDVSSANKVTLNYYFKNIPIINQYMTQPNTSNGVTLDRQTVWTGYWESMLGNRWNDGLNAVNRDDWHSGYTGADGWTDTAFAASWTLKIPANKTAKVAYVFTTSVPQTTKKITYYPNGASGTATSRTETYWGEHTIISNPYSRSGYAFKGWATSSTGAVAYQPGNKITVVDNLNLYAVWEKTYTVLTKPTLSGTYTYNGSAQAAVLSGFNSSLMNVSGNVQTNAGTYTITISLKDKNNYVWADGTNGNITLNWTINKRALTITAKNQTITYGDNIATGTGQITQSGLASGQYISSVTLTPSRSTAGTGTITPSRAVIKSGSTTTTTNYTITYKAGTLTINKKALTKPTLSGTYTYNGSAQAAVLSGFNSSLMNVSGNVQTNAGTYTITISLKDKNNYVWADGTNGNITLNWTINKRALTITAKNQTITYGDNIATGTGQITQSGLASGQTITAITLTPSRSTAGTGTITPSGAVIKSGSTTTTINYTITYKAGTLTINRRNINTGQIAMQNYVYNGSEIKSAPVLIVNGVTLVQGIDYTIAYSNNINAGIATGTATGIGNYTGTIRGNFEIYKKDVSVVWGETNFIYDSGYKIPTAEVDSGVAGETIVLSLIGQQIVPGTYTANAYISRVDGGNARIENYNLLDTSIQFIISKQVVPVEWSNLTLYYTGLPQKPTATATAFGAAGEDVSVEMTMTGEQTEVGGPYVATVSPTNPNYTLSPNVENFYIIPNPNVTFSGTLNPDTYVYDGDEKRPTTTVTAHGVASLEGKELVLGKDYIVNYENNIEPSSDATAKIIGIGNYEGTTLDLKFTIEKKERNSTVNMNDYYFGTTLPTPSITDGEEAENVTYYYLEANRPAGGTDWNKVSDSESIPVGAYYMYAIIPETAHYKEYTTTTTPFRVLPGQPTDPIVENKVYNGELQIGVYGGQGLILSGTTEAINVGTYTAYGDLADNYEWPANMSGQRTYTWKIYPCNIANTEITLNPTTYKYDGTAHEPTVTVLFNGKRLVKNKDYTVEYRNNINVGRAEAVITGINNFSGVVTKYFTITPLNIERLELEDYTYYYTGEKIKPVATVYGEDGKKLIENKDYIIEYRDNLEIGTAVAVAIGINNYTGELTREFQITGENIARATAKLIGVPYVYDGSEKCPKAEVVFGDEILQEGRDYVMSYENNVNAGENTAIAIITGCEEYEGEIRIPFTIMKAYRDAYILPGKAILLNNTDNIPYYYKGEDSQTTLIIDDTTIASATDKVYTQNGTIDLTALAVGKTTLELVVAESQNYHELVLNSEVTVFEKESDTYPIYGTVIINDDDEYTNSPRTMLTLNVDFGDYMYISESPETPSIDAPEWYEFSKKMPYEFDSVEGEKIIYAWFKDKKGNMSQRASDTIILKYDATVPLENNNISAHDYALLDQTQIDKTAPDIEFDKYLNKTLNIEVIFKQEDVMVNGVRSGVDHGTMQYGYREAEEGMPNDVYNWQDTPVIEGLEYDTDYAFVTRAYDRAGNGYTVSEETLIHTERKYVAEFTFEDTNRQYTGEIQEIEEAVFTLVNDTPITGTVTYTYYVDKDCTVKTNPTRDGSLEEGTAPSKPGIYYVTLELKGDKVYYDIPDDGEEPPMAKLRIGWDISKTEDDDVFAYPERTDIDSEEYILNVIGNGEMADLEELLATNKEEEYVYWSEYQDKIVELEIANDNENTISNIGNHIFHDLDKITEIIIPDTIESIGDYAFENCTGVTEKIIIPLSVAEIGANPFTNVNTPEFETVHGQRQFDTIDGVLVDIDHNELVAYPNGKTDERYTIPDEVEIIKESAFSGADNLTNVVIPNGVEEIKTRAFYNCPNLEIVEVEDLMEDNILDLKNVGTNAFSEIKEGSIIYTFSEEVAKKFEEDVTHIGAETEVYWPPVFTLHPIDMNGAEGWSVKFIVDTKPGYPEETQYQWYRVKDGTASLISGATSKEYTTPRLTAENDKDKYCAIAYNDDYYFNRGYAKSNEATLNMLDEANYIVVRGTYNSYLFERLQDAFDFAITDDVVKPLKNVMNEKESTLTGNKSIQLDLESYKIYLDEIIQIESGSKLEIIGDDYNGGINKSGEYIIENEGELIINGDFTLSNQTGFGIKTMDDSTLTYTAGNISVDRNAIYAENATVTINGAGANVNANTSQTIATAVSLHKNTKFSMTNGNISIAYNTQPATGSLYGIFIDCESTEVTRISGGTITTTSTNLLADAVANAGNSKIYISGDARIEGSRSGIVLLDSDLYGDVTVESGKIIGGAYGILNMARSAKVILGTEGSGVSITSPVIVGEKVAIFNAKERDTLEFYDGVLYSHGNNIIYEDMDNTTLSIPNTNTELIYTADEREPITTEKNYSIFTDVNVDYNSSKYNVAYLKENKYPTLTGPDDQIVDVGEQAVFEVVATGGFPDVYDYEWQVSTDGGRTWTATTVGVGYNTSRYITPIVNVTMDGYMYRCIVTNAKGSVTSREATLLVVESDDILKQRPVARIVFANGRKIETEYRDGSEVKVVNMKLIAKSTAELKSLKLNGEEILGHESYTLSGGMIEVTKDPLSPIHITKTIDSINEIVEYTYTYNLKIYNNGILTVDIIDVKDRDNTITQTVDLFYDLKVQYYLSKLTETNKNLVITFYANKPVKPTSSMVNSYINSTYLDLISLDGGEYSYRYHLELTNPLPETTFFFEDEVHNETFVKVDAIARVNYRDVKFNTGIVEIDDLTILNAYEMAQELEEIVEVNSNEEIQNRYGVNSVEVDMFMSRARDIGAVDILNNATSAKSYDGIFTADIDATVASKDSAYDYVETSSNTYVAAAAKASAENDFTAQDKKYVDIIERTVELYKGMDLNGFRIDDMAPYMYKDGHGANNIAAVTIAKATFRATIIGK